MSTVQIVPGFSLVNRWLLYTSFMLAPAQYASGLKSHCPSNIGFLAYNWYTQISWLRAIRAKQLHALSLVPVHYNTVCCITYLGGITSGNIPMAITLGLGSAGVMLLNNVAAWVSWATNQAEGFGHYRFYFFGWRTLSPAWHKFFLVWQISDSLEALGFAVFAIAWAIRVVDAPQPGGKKIFWWYRYPAIPVGAAAMLIFGWPLILWTELVVSGNHIESATDWVAVGLFVAQAASMLVPSCGIFSNE
jgi:hypothetical protein